MEKKEFISRLQEMLIERGFDKATVEAEMIPVAAYLDESGMKDIDIPVEGMANEISDMLSEKKKEEIPQQAEVEDDIEAALRASGADLGPAAPKDSPKSGIPEKETPAEEPEELKEGKRPVVPDLKKKRREAGKKAEKEQNSAGTDGAAEEAVALSDGKSGKEPVAENEEESYSADDEVEDIDVFSPGSQDNQEPKPGFLSMLILKLRNLVSGKKEKTADGEGEEGTDAAEYDDGKNKVLFWVIFAIAVPIVLALALCVIALYIAFWIALALLMIFLVAALIVFVFGGALVSIIGIIYGVIMIIKGVAPVGLYEIGLGITVGAAVMFIGIFVYNFAIRLIPFGMKMLAKLLGFALKRGKEGLASVKKTIKSI